MIEVVPRLESISRGTAMPADLAPQKEPGSWFVGSNSSDSELASGPSIEGHSTWSQPSSAGDVGHSFNYQMTFIQEGR